MLSEQTIGQDATEGECVLDFPASCRTHEAPKERAELLRVRAARADMDQVALGGGRLHAGAADFEYERGAVLQVREVLIRPREPEVSTAVDLEEVG